MQGTPVLGRRLTDAVRSLLTALVATAAAVLLTLVASIATGVQLLTSTLLVMGGNDNPAALTPSMQQQLGGDPWYPGADPDVLRPVGVFGEGYIDAANNPASPYFGFAVASGCASAYPAAQVASASAINVLTLCFNMPVFLMLLARTGQCAAGQRLASNRTAGADPFGCGSRWRAT